jgi:hypothetical protein
MEATVRPRLTAVAIAIIVSLGIAATRAYFVEPKTSANGWTEADPNAFVGQSFVANVDSIYYLEWFVAEPSDSGFYVFDVLDQATSQLIAHGQKAVPEHGWQWVRCDNWTQGNLQFTKGKEYIVKVSHSAGDSVNYVVRTDNPYQYGEISVGGGQLQPPPQTTTDLVARILGRMNTVDSAFWGMDEWCFVPWVASPDSVRENREELRQEVAQIAKSAHVGSMMTYARWPTLLWPNDPITRHWEDFNARLYSVVSSDWADARPIVNITEVSRFVSSRVDTVVDEEKGETLFNAGYCAPRKLFEPVSSDSNYWAAYIRDLLLHTETDQSRQWPNNRPGDVIHAVEIWNEPNDTCVSQAWYDSGVTGWWRRPKVEYTTGFDSLEGLCRLYVRMASVAESVIHHQCGAGHQNDTILIGVTHRMLDSNDIFLARGLSWVRTCYQIATSGSGPGIFWDGISFHPYQGDYGFDPARFEVMAESVRAVARSFGDYDCQVWCSEVGTLGYDGFDPAEINAHYQQDAGRYLPELYTSVLASQALPGARYDRCQWWWFSTTDTRSCYGLVGLQDIDLGDSTDAGGKWQVFGSCSTFQTLAEKLTDLRFESRVHLGDSLKEDSVRIYEFSAPQADDERLWVGWAVEPTGRGNADVTAKVPARTDSVAVLSGSSLAIVPADADGWLRLTVSTQSLYIVENGNTHRPDVVVDSLKMMPSPLAIGLPATAHVYFHNAASVPVPEGPATGQHYTWVVLRHNGDSVAQAFYDSQLYPPNNSGSVSITVASVPSSWHGTGLFDATANYGQVYVELNGMDDNDGYSRNRVTNLAQVDSPAVACGRHHNEPLVPLGLRTFSTERDTTGQTPCDSARVVQYFFGVDTVVQAADTSEWFCLNPSSTTFDTSWQFLFGPGKYRLLVQAKDSWSESELIPDSAHAYVYFDTTGPTGSIAINGGQRFTTSSNCTLSLAASDSISGVADMRLANIPRVNLVSNGSFTAAGGSWSYSGGGSGYDTILGLAKLAAGGATCVRQFIPAESISAYAGDSCVLQASVMALMHGGNALGDLSYWLYKTRQDTSLHDTSWTLVDSATFQDSLAFWGQSPYGGNNLTRRFLLSVPSAESGWVWRGGMVRVQAVGINGATGTVWADNIALNGLLAILCG